MKHLLGCAIIIYYIYILYLFKKCCNIYIYIYIPKMLFIGEIFGENLWRGVHGGTNDQIIGQDAFSNNL